MGAMVRNDDAPLASAAGAVCANALLMKNIVIAFMTDGDLRRREIRRAIIAAALSNTVPALVRKPHTKLAKALRRDSFARPLH